VKIVTKLLTRLFCAGLIFLCAQKTAAGIFFEAGRHAYQEKRYGEALSLMDRSLRWNFRDPGALYVAGQSSWKLAQNEEDEPLLEKAGSYFEALAADLPFYGRAWLYLGFVKLEKEKKGGKISPAFWEKEIKPLFQKAARYEPGSAWVSYKVASTFLKEAPSLTAADQNGLMEKLRQASHLNSKAYLKPSLSVLWERFGDFRLLELLVPENFSAYRLWLEWIAEKNLWEHAEPVFRRYLEVQRKEYGEICALGEASLATADYSMAIRHFERAYWIQSRWTRARAGLLKVYESIGEIPEKYRSWENEIKAQDEKREIDAPTVLRPAKAWWNKKGNSVIGPKEKTGVLLKFLPGAKELSIALRSFPDGNGVYGFVLFRAAGEIVGFRYVNAVVWEKVKVPIEAKGGPVWLEAELLNLPPPAGSRKAVVQLGDVEVRDV
jgi:hypothetical protein